MGSGVKPLSQWLGGWMRAPVAVDVWSRRFGLEPRPEPVVFPALCLVRRLPSSASGAAWPADAPDWADSAACPGEDRLLPAGRWLAPRLVPRSRFGAGEGVPEGGVPSAISGSSGPPCAEEAD